MKQATVGLNLRRATLDDGPFLLAVRNAEDIRSQSKVRNVISEETHQGWLQQQLKSSDAVIWIIERGKDRLGYIRAQKSGDQREEADWLLSVALHASARGQGHADWALKEVCGVMRRDIGAGRLITEVLSTNVAACRLFRKAGFVDRVRTEDGGSPYVRFEFPLVDIDGSSRAL